MTFMNHGSWKILCLCDKLREVLMLFFHSIDFTRNKLLFRSKERVSTIDDNKSMKLFPSIVTLRFIEFPSEDQPSLKGKFIARDMGGNGKEMF